MYLPPDQTVRDFFLALINYSKIITNISENQLKYDDYKSEFQKSEVQIAKVFDNIQAFSNYLPKDEVFLLHKLQTTIKPIRNKLHSVDQNLKPNNTYIQNFIDQDFNEFYDVLVVTIRQYFLYTHSDFLDQKKSEV